MNEIDDIDKMEAAIYGPMYSIFERIARALEGLLELAESAAQAPNDEEG